MTEESSMNENNRDYGLKKTNYDNGVETALSSLRSLSKDPDIIIIKERQFKCEFQSCGQKFLSAASMKRHRQRCHSELEQDPAVIESVARNIKFSCSICGKIFSQQGNLRSHMRTHSKELPFSCNFASCRRSFNSSDALKRHKLTHLGIKLFDCDICGQRCSSNLALKEHVARHQDLKPHRCDTCGKVFRQVSCYRRHLLTHNSNRPFKCDICHQTFSQTSYLKSHMKSHTGEKPYACETCSKRFAHASDRNRHMAVHTAEKKFSCSLCGSRFSDASSCRRHIREHSSTKTNLCTLCNSSFKRLFQLRYHMTKRHGLDPDLKIPSMSICQRLPTENSSDCCPSGVLETVTNCQILETGSSSSFFVPESVINVEFPQHTLEMENIMTSVLVYPLSTDEGQASSHDPVTFEEAAGDQSSLSYTDEQKINVCLENSENAQLDSKKAEVLHSSGIIRNTENKPDVTSDNCLSQLHVPDITRNQPLLCVYNSLQIKATLNDNCSYKVMQVADSCVESEQCAENSSLNLGSSPGCNCHDSTLLSSTCQVCTTDQSLEASFGMTSDKSFCEVSFLSEDVLNYNVSVKDFSA